MINNRTYRGQLEPLAVINAICAGFENPPQMCKGILNSSTPDFLVEEKGIRGGVIVAIVFVLIILNMLIVYCYRRYARREMQQDMQVQIEGAVSQYFALTQNEAKPYVK